MELSGEFHAPAALPAGKKFPISIRQGVGGPQNRTGRGGKDKNSFIATVGNQTPIVHPVA
jgi:hypothetical protein